jgi:putative Mn2+ efflux pump MntP
LALFSSLCGSARTRPCAASSPRNLTAIGVPSSALGLFAGRRFGARLGRRLDVLGGLVLIALGAKILVEHLSAG